MKDRLSPCSIHFKSITALCSVKLVGPQPHFPIHNCFYLGFLCCGISGITSGFFFRAMQLSLMEITEHWVPLCSNPKKFGMLPLTTSPKSLHRSSGIGYCSLLLWALCIKLFLVAFPKSSVHTFVNTPFITQIQTAILFLLWRSSCYKNRNF